MKKLFTRDFCMDLATKINGRWNVFIVGKKYHHELKFGEHNMKIILDTDCKQHSIVTDIRVLIGEDLEAQFSIRSDANQEKIANDIFKKIHTFTKLLNPDYNPYVCLEDQILSKLINTNPWVSAHIRCDEDCYIFTMTTERKSENDDRKVIQLTLALVDENIPEPNVRFSKSYIVKDLDTVTELVVDFTDQAAMHFENQFFSTTPHGETEQ